MRQTTRGQAVVAGALAVVAIAVLLSILLIHVGGHGGGITTVTTR